MKLFSRKALVAGAAAVAVAFAGTSVANAEDAPTTATSSVSDLYSGSSFGNSSKDEKKADPEENKDGEDATDAENPEGNDGDAAEGEQDNGDENKGSSFDDPKELTAWISVFTAIVGALGAVFSFAGKYLKSSLGTNKAAWALPVAAFLVFKESQSEPVSYWCCPGQWRTRLSDSRWSRIRTLAALGLRVRFLLGRL